MSVAGPSGSFNTRLSMKSRCIPSHGVLCVGNADGVSEAQGCAKLSGALLRSSVISSRLLRCQQMPDGTTFTSRTAAGPRSYCTLNIRLDRFAGVFTPATIRRSIGPPDTATLANFGDRPHVEGSGRTGRVDEMPPTPYDTYCRRRWWAAAASSSRLCRFPLGATDGGGPARSSALWASHSLAASSVSRNCTPPAASNAIGSPSR
jgi:hypothetical protein